MGATCGMQLVPLAGPGPAGRTPEYLFGCAEGVGVCELVGSLTEWSAALVFWDELLGKKELAPLAVQGWPGLLCTVHNVLLEALGLGGFEGIWGWCARATACCGVSAGHSPASGAPTEHDSSGRALGSSAKS